MLAPHHSFTKLYNEYKDTRGTSEYGATLESSNMCLIDIKHDYNYPSNKFRLNKNLPIFKSIHKQGKGIFLANTGYLSKPITKYNYFTEVKTQLFSHHSKMIESNLVDTFSEKHKTDILGRIIDVFEKKNYTVGGIIIDKTNLALHGDPELIC